jgi:hypothetical protein
LSVGVATEPKPSAASPFLVAPRTARTRVGSTLRWSSTRAVLGHREAGRQWRRIGIGRDGLQTSEERLRDPVRVRLDDRGLPALATLDDGIAS